MACPCDDTKRKMPRCDAGTPPVLEVSCGETPVLFHTVTIPASVGDVETVPPTPGAYRNTRVFYEVDNVSYLYDSDGIPQLLSGGTTGVMSVNGQTGNVIIPDATTDSNGLMSGADKAKLNNMGYNYIIPVEAQQGNTAAGNYAYNEFKQKDIVLPVGKYLVTWAANTINTPSAADQTQCRTKVISGATELTVSTGMAPACANKVYRPCMASYTTLEVTGSSSTVTLSLQLQTETAGTYGMYATTVIIQRIQ